MSRFLVRPVRTIVILMSVYGFMLLNLLTGSLRFTSPRLNVLSMTAALCIPAICCVILTVAPQRNVWRIVSAVGLALLAGVSACGAMFGLSMAGYDIKANQDSGFSLLRTVPISGVPTRIYAYRGFTNESDTIVVRQEFPVLPGLIWIHELDKRDASRDVKIKVLDPHRFLCTFTGNPEDCDVGNCLAKHTVVLTAH